MKQLELILIHWNKGWKELIQIGKESLRRGEILLWIGYENGVEV